MHDNQKQQIINAIRDLGRRVTAADVATKTGLPVLVVQQKLNEVASDTSGHMQVGSAGDIVYSFSPAFASAYLAKGVSLAMQQAGEKIFNVLFYLVRISFGIALILSLVIVVVLIIATAFLMSRGAGGDDRRDGGMFDGDLFGGGGGGGFHFSFWDWMILRDLLWWNGGYRNYEPVRYRYDQPTVRRRSRSSFLLNCFSFLFGDGDPNEGLAEKKWQVIAQVIKHHNNVVTSEQLAPYTGADPNDQDAVLPVLARFNGRPEVSDSGNIVYVFESLQTIAAEQTINPPPFLQEFKWKFTNVDEGELLPVYIVAGLNVAGSWYLWNVVTHLNLESVPATAIPSAHNLVLLVLGLVIYGTAFVAIPIIRTIINKLRNVGIEKRNIARFRYSQMLANPTPELKTKLKEAYLYKVRDRKISQQDVVYTTEKDSLDQDDELSDQFKQLENSKAGSKPQKGKQYNFAPEAGSVAVEDHSVSSNEDDVREIPPGGTIRINAEEDDVTDQGGVIDLSKKRAEKIKTKKKNSDLDSTT
jgi:hypothetical protein